MKHIKHHLISDKKRKSIVRKVKSMIKADRKDYDSLSVGERILVFNDYVENVCNELGYEVSNFYMTDTKTLDMLFLMVGID